MAGRPLRIGIVGAGRGLAFARGTSAQALGLELSAVCDSWEHGAREVGRRLGVATYTDFDRFLEHDLDGVVLANYFHQHAPFAIRCLQAGRHVLSEVSACMTLAEGVALIRAVESSGLTYVFGENYPYMAFNQEMRRLYRQGAIGRAVYGEAEYIHPFPVDAWNEIAPGLNHWRNWLPMIYYCTHTVGPLMYITDTWPRKVNGFVIPYDSGDRTLIGTARRGDPAGVIVCRMSDGSVTKALHGTIRGHGVSVRVHGSRGAMETMKFGSPPGTIVVRHEPWDLQDGEEEFISYAPGFPEEHAEAAGSGHGGSDYFVLEQFTRAIRTGEPPDLDVHRGVAMSIVGILAYRSALADSAPLAVPDLTVEAERETYASDNWSPDPSEHGPGQPWPSILGDVQPSPDAIREAERLWAEDESRYGGIERLLPKGRHDDRGAPVALDGPDDG